MSELDLDDVAAGNPAAMRELEALRAEVVKLRGWLEAEAQAAVRLQRALNNADNNAERDTALLRQALDALRWIGDCYVGDDDDAGECASCHERSYKPHSPDCKKNNAIAALSERLEKP